jgi:hypothetical protein
MDVSLMAHLSNLRSLTHLTVRSGFWGPECKAALQAGLSPLSRLRQLALAAALPGSEEPPPLTLALPSSQLASLTAVRLERFVLGSEGPVAFGAVQDLELRGCRLDNLGALSACPQLTRLLHAGTLQHGSKSAALPVGWRDGLRSLAWHGCGTSGIDATMGWVEQLTGLTRLSLQAISTEPALFR